ncbi:MAG TPA: Clp protease ClpC, partial [Saprospirales bacterium]|nr:Clp protease ClpC [Saprospirales bacterium]
NTIIIMTSNVGARQVKDFGRGLGFETASQKAQSQEIEKGVIEKELKKTFSPEFLNRIDDVVIFNSLDQDDIFNIIDITLNDLFARLDNMGYKLILADDAKKFVAEKGYDPQFGARPLHRAIQKYMEDPLAEFILANNPGEGSRFKASLNKEKDGIKITFTKKVAKEEEDIAE